MTLSPFGPCAITLPERVASDTSIGRSALQVATPVIVGFSDSPAYRLDWPMLEL